MEKKFIIFSLLIGLFINLTVGCEGVDDYSTNPDLRLDFSTDTLSFDTVFTTIGSATKHFKVYNPHNENLRIESVALANPGKSGFRINVDGRKGSSFRDIDIWKRDSLYILVEVTVDPNNSDQPMIVEDSILFYTNGVRQSVLLQACGQDVHLLKGGVTYTENTTLTANRPYLIYDSLVIAEGVTVTLQPGATLYFHKHANLIVSGNIKAKGTREKPIVFRGDRLDSIYTNVTLAYDRIPGQWGGIYFGASSLDNEFEQVIVKNTTSGLFFHESTSDNLKIRIRDSQITNSQGNLLTAVNCRIEVSNSEFTNAAENTVFLIGGSYQFTHCTIANYMKLAPRKRVAALVLSDTAKINNRSVHLPIRQAAFDNCIIDGSLHDDTTKLYRGEISFFTKDNRPEGGDGFNYHFNSCLIQTKKITDNPRFVQCIFNRRPTYIRTGSEDDAYAFDFRLANKSVGISGADRAVTARYPTDRYGVGRLNNTTGPSIGAYEYVYQEEKKKK